MEALRRFLVNMDAKRWRTAAFALGMFAAIGLLFLFGKTTLGLDTEREVTEGLRHYAGGPWGLIAAIVVFTAAAFIGAPQFLLIAACVVAFGPWLGFLYSWIATIVSAAATFWLGRIAGGRALDRFGGTIARLTRYVGRNAFYGSFIIRNVPSAPFIVVNMAFGVARAPLLPFLAGCALGVLPKTALVAAFGGSFMTAVKGDGVHSTLIIAAIGLFWLAIMLLAREFVRRRTANEADPR
jgi:uncharacterized membrane protein YdjX (TVP38/TMEM64 family)